MDGVVENKLSADFNRPPLVLLLCSDELGAPDDDIIFEDFARLRLKGAETEA